MFLHSLKSGAGAVISDHAPAHIFDLFLQPLTGFKIYHCLVDETHP
jgi:hypothetical protein